MDSLETSKLEIFIVLILQSDFPNVFICYRGSIDEQLLACSNCHGSSTEPVRYDAVVGKRVFVSTLSTATRYVKH